MITPEIVIDFWRYFNRIYDSKVVDKKSTLEMFLISKMLRLMGVNPKDFLEKYTTTLGRKIYIPFKLGSPNQVPNLIAQVIICVHEHQHIEQLDRDGRVAFYGGYAANPTMRALYEAEAYRCNMEMNLRLSGEIKEGFKELAAKLKNYLCRPSDIQMAERILESNEITIRHGGLTTDASIKALEWFEKYAPDVLVKRSSDS